MYLTREEERILSGECGHGKQKAMEILAALGDIYGADKLIPIESAQIAGVSYKTIGDAGLEYLADLTGSVVVPAMLNPIGMDRLKWKELGIDSNFFEKQMAIIERYETLGVEAQCTCTPYYVRPVRRGAHLSWSESSAVSYANSVLKARTNREGGPSALAAAMIGKTPNYGYHLDENRAADILVQVTFPLVGSDYGALGYVVGKMVQSKIPAFSFVKEPRDDELKALAASMAASGSVALFHIDSAGKYEETLEVQPSDIQLPAIGEPDAIVLGCPHCSRAELVEIGRLLHGRKVQRPLWICTSRFVAQQAATIISRIEETGAHVICDTCMIVSPAFEGCHMMVNSGKAFEYGPSLCRSPTSIGSTSACVEMACTA
ncbi:MAG: aconitase X [Halobacteriota archaeon]